MTRRSICALVLVGALVACSAPAQQTPPGSGYDVPAAGGDTATNGTVLGSIGSPVPGPSSEPSGPTAAAARDTTAASTAAGASGGTASAPPTTAAEAAARARVQTARQEATKAEDQAAQAAAAQCEDIASQIRAEQATERAAPSTSIDEDIVAATLAKADKRIDRLEQQYDSLNCPDSELPAARARVPQLPPAPGALPP